MNILIVAKTRRGSGACVGGITETGRSVRLIAADAAWNERAGLEYEVGEVWEIESTPDSNLVPPHVENILVLGARRLRRSQKLEQAIQRFMPPMPGGPEKLFEGLVQPTRSGALYIAERTGLPPRSTMFWLPEQPLQLDCESKRLRYRYPTSDGGRTLTFVGFQEPLPEIPAGTLLRVSLAHWWRPLEHPEHELRCFVQLSGWFLNAGNSAQRGGDSLSAQIAARSSGDKLSPPPPVELGTSSRVVPQAKVLEVLHNTFGLSQFLPLQAEVITRILQRQDALVVMPTGGGKSLCYELPALLFEGLTVVVSPLVALMQDQVRQLRALGVPAACLNHLVPLQEYTAAAEQVRQGHIRLLYLAPETLLRPESLLLLEQSRLACLAVDEAHCISEWGHDFRPEYRQLEEVRHRFPQTVCLALTATATGRVREDIRRLLGIPAPGEFIASFNRPNLFLSVEPRQDGLAQVLDFLAQHRGESGIIYCGTRKHTDDLAAALNANGWPALPYHAGLDGEVRRRNQERFSQENGSLMVATVAFGMGINKANIRFVVHAHLPKDLESYYQEIGRAGRDGLPAQCLLLYSRGDAMLQRHLIDQGAASETPGRRGRLNALVRFAEACTCRRELLLAYFGETLQSPCGGCDNCVRPARPVGQTANVTAAAQQFLACVKLTGQVFGPAHIIAILRGSNAARVLERHHDCLSSYGAGRGHSPEEWRELAQQFLRLGLMEAEVEFGRLHLTPKGREVLQGKQEVLVPARPAIPAPNCMVRPFVRRRFHEIGELFAAGKSLAELAQQYQLTSRTLMENLHRFVETGGRLEPQRVLALSRVPEPERARALSAFERLGLERLAPVHDALAGAVSYDELHVLRLYLRCRCAAKDSPVPNPLV